MQKPSYVLPSEYTGLPEEEITRRLRECRTRLGKNLVILAHHYQRKEIVELSDFRGDSYGLSKRASQQVAEHIVFCGVHFMAESADILTRDEQKVYLPNPAATCPLAAMAEIADVETAWEALEETVGSGRVIPVTYVNSDAELKAFCGARGGSVCTSSNAAAVIEWAFRQKEKVLFFPDEHLGRNTGKCLRIDRESMVVWDPELHLGGRTAEELSRARLILWKGFCHVHVWFTREHVESIRKAFPKAKVIVHPECVEDVVESADESGSTEFIVNYVRSAPAGSVIAVGTEINLVSKLAAEHPDKKVFELSRSLCGNMFKINPRNLLWTMESLGQVNRVEVDPVLKADARTALERMLRISEAKK
ncbi:MAG: quinolinate synthase NadA [Candidatus Eisenbacteria bacterium]